MSGDTKYTAFISYNHNPRDIDIAKELQKRLERYRIPKDIKSSHKIEKINRVFLDVGELGVSADLNDTIKNALDNTEKLIVISSPESKESPWVHKEVEHFLTKHSVDSILTVITDGDPKDVLPGEIMHVRTVDESGNEIITDREPLSCDYRDGIKVGNKKELSRLVAGIIGCKYDDLIQRQRQYRFRQMAIGLSALSIIMFAALSYFIWSNQKIKENYDNTLIEQSKSLALQSEEALNNGDRVGAIKYALEALPQKNADRPVVTEAVLALARSMKLYQSKSGMKYYDGIKEITTGKIRHTDVISENNQHIYAVDTHSNELKIFNVNTGEQYAKDTIEQLLNESEYSLSAFKLINNTSVLMLFKNSLLSFDYVEDKINWSLENKEEAEEIYSDEAEREATYYDSDSFSCKDNKLVAVKSKESFLKADEVVQCVDLNNGEIICESALPDYESKYPNIEKIDISPSGKSAALMGEYYLDDKSIPCLFKVNLENGDINELDKSNAAEINDIAFMPNGEFVFCGLSDKQDDETAVPNADYLDFQEGRDRVGIAFIIKKTVVVSNLGVDAEKAEWITEFSEVFSGTPSIANCRDNNSNKPIVITGSKAREFSENGKELHTIEIQAGIVTAWRNKLNDKDVIYLVLRDGSLGRSYDEHKHSIVNTGYFPDSIVGCEVMEDCIYIVCHDEGDAGNYRVIKYDSSFKGDKKWEPYEIRENDEIYLIEARAFQDSFIEYYSIDDAFYIDRIDAKTGETKWTCSIEAPDYHHNNKKIMIDYSGRRAVMLESAELDYESDKSIFNFITINLENGLTEKKTAELNYTGYSYEFAGITEEGQLLVLAEHANNNQEESHKILLATISIDEGKVDYTELEGEEAFGFDMHFHYSREQGDLMMLDEEENKVKVFDYDGDAVFELKDPGYIIKCATIGVDGNIYLIGNETGKNKYSRTGNFTIHCYDKKTGKEKEVGLRIDENTFTNDAFDYSADDFEIIDMSDDEVMVKFSPYLSMVYDKADGKLRYEMADFECYNHETQQLYIDKGHAPYRTLEEMITEAEELVS